MMLFMTINKFTHNLTSIIRERRIKAGMTQDQLAQALHLGRASIIAIETGKNVQLHTIAKVADYLGIRLADSHQQAQNHATPRKATRRINARHYPQLLSLLWDRKHHFDTDATEPVMIAPREAYRIYEAHERFIDREKMEPHEKRFLKRLINGYGGGIFLGQ